MKRKWTEGQRNFVQRNKIVASAMEPIEIYEENGVKIKRYAADAAQGIRAQSNVKSSKMENGFLKF